MFNHSLVVVKDKLFVISKKENGCEVFENICKTFNTIKSLEFSWFSFISAYSIANNILFNKTKIRK